MDKDGKPTGGSEPCSAVMTSAYAVNLVSSAENIFEVVTGQNKYSIMNQSATIRDRSQKLTGKMS